MIQQEFDRFFSFHYESSSPYQQHNPFAYEYEGPTCSEYVSPSGFHYDLPASGLWVTWPEEEHFPQSRVQTPVIDPCSAMVPFRTTGIDTPTFHVQMDKFGCQQGSASLSLHFRDIPDTSGADIREVRRRPPSHYLQSPYARPLNRRLNHLMEDFTLWLELGDHADKCWMSISLLCKVSLGSLTLACNMSCEGKQRFWTVTSMRHARRYG